MSGPVIIDGDEAEYRERFAAVFDQVMGDTVSPEVRDAVRERMVDVALKCYKLPEVTLTVQTIPEGVTPEAFEAARQEIAAAYETAYRQLIQDLQWDLFSKVLEVEVARQAR